MLLFEWILLLLFAAVVLANLADRLAAPYPSLLAIAGACLAFLPFAPKIVIEPELALALFIAPALLDAAFDTSPRDLAATCCRSSRWRSAPSSSRRRRWPISVGEQRGGLATLTITEQQGNTFTGRLKRANPIGDEEEPLWGAFTPGGKLMMGSDDEGTYMFNLIDQNTLDYCYSETGSTPKTICARLTRQP